MIKLQGIRNECCVMCGNKDKTYTLAFQKKSGENIISFNLCGKCIERCHDTMENFINTMLRGNDHEHEEV